MSNNTLFNLPLGYDNFGDIISRNMHYVDKTLMIKEFIDRDSVQVSLITRPRRFGKSLNLSMLQHFFAAEVTAIPTKGLFDQLKIAQLGDAYMQYQGQFSVISVSFKDVKERSFQSALNSLRSALSFAFYEHRQIVDHPSMTTVQKEAFNAVLNRAPTDLLLGDALRDLSNYLSQCYGQKVILLIDEYDAPIQSAYLHGYYDEMIGVIRHMFSAALKTNPYLHRALLTGILRVSKESLFSGLNNIDVYSTFRSEYSEYYGFTDAEVAAVFKQSGLSVSLDDVRTWYNGYQMGSTTVYNPWSIASCINRQGELLPYWVGTSGNELIKHLIAKTSDEFKIIFESLLQQTPVTQLIDENFVFTDLNFDESTIWSLLLACGYLKVVSVAPAGTRKQCSLLIPNYEVLCLYQDIFMQWFSDKIGYTQYQRFLTNLLSGHVPDFIKTLQNFLLESASHFDVKGTHPEKFYHGFVLGLMASLHKTHIIKSNHESGYGRYDVMIIPRDITQRGVVMEFKNVEENDDINTIAKSALQQVNDKNYETELRQAGITSILKMGLAFKGKTVAVVYEET